MDLDRITIALRPRSSWEAMDLGFALARRSFGVLWRLWLVTALPVLALLLFLPRGSTPWVLLLMWWLKPLYEPFLLYWLSRSLFGEVLPLSTVVRRWRQIAGTWLLHSLTWRRFQPERSFQMPVFLLEELDSAGRRARIRILGRGQGGPMWLTVLCFVVELVLAISGLLLFFILIPDGLRYGAAADFLHRTENLQGIVAAALAMSLVGPLYVAAGFMLYISRRVDLEAWDIELGFRQVARRLAERRRRNLERIAAVVLFACLVQPHFSVAAPLPPPEQARTVVRQVLADRDFGHTETITTWQRIEKKSDADDRGWFATLLSTLAGATANMYRFLAEILRRWTGPLAVFCKVALLLGAGGLIGWVLVRYGGLARLLPGGRARVGAAAAPGVLFGMAVTPESLPDDIAAACRRLLEQERPRQALALLYRATLSCLVHGRGLEVPASATEAECLQLVQRHRGRDEADCFRRLTSAWLQTAYGHHRPSRQGLEELVNSWSVTFAEQAR